MKLTRTLPVLLLIAAALCAPSYAADLPSILLNRELGTTVARYAAGGGNIGLRIQYIGTVSIGGAAVAVDGAGDLFFYTDASVHGTLVADTSVSTDGQIDVSGASEDTWGEVCDAINASANWRAILVDVLPSHSANDTLTSTTGYFATYKANVSDPEGKSLYVSLADADEMSLSIGPEYTLDEVLSVSNDRLDNRSATPGQSVSPTWTCELYKAVVIPTFTTGAPDIEVYAVKDHGAGATEILLWSQAGPATTETGTIDLTDLPPIRAPRGWRLVITADDDTTPDMTACTMQIHGLFYEQ